MKQRKVCPKCNSSDILVVPGKAGAYGSGNNIMTGMTIFSSFTYVFGLLSEKEFLSI